VSASLSVICPVFDTPAHFLREAMESVLREPAATVIELVFVDDGSTRAETLDFLRGVASSPRITVLWSGRREGPAGARNRGIAAARGEFVGFVDSDDVWLGERAALLGRVLAAAPEAALILANRVLTQGGVPDPTDMGRLEALYRLAELAPGVFRLDQPDLARDWIGLCPLHLGQALVRRELALAHPIPPLWFAEDTLFFIRLACVTPAFFVPETVYALRQGHDSLTASPRRLREGLLPMFRAARADPLLAGHARPIRWGFYQAAKRSAVENLLAGRRLDAARFALTAWRTDPREWRDAWRFLGLLARGRGLTEAECAAYSPAPARAIHAGPRAA
jgi:glycosyltransferase involved in cell wall biosynthesis